MKPGSTTAPRRSTILVRRPRHRSACVDVPTARKRSPRIARAFAHGRSRAAVKTLPSTRTMSASPGISAHVPQIPEALDGFAERLVSLGEHEPHVSPAVDRVAVERGAGDDRDPQSLHEVHRERPIVLEREAVEVRDHVIRAPRWPAGEPGVPKPAHAEIPPS